MTYRQVSRGTTELVAAAGLDIELVRRAVTAALDEDLAYGPDVTTAATVSADQWVAASIGARGTGVVAGVPVAMVTLRSGDRGQRTGSRCLERVDGSAVGPGDEVLALEGPTRGLLTAERTTLNFLGHLSGVATATATWAEAVRARASARHAQDDPWPSGARQVRRSLRWRRQPPHGTR